MYIVLFQYNLQKGSSNFNYTYVIKINKVVRQTVKVKKRRFSLSFSMSSMLEENSVLSNTGLGKMWFYLWARYAKKWIENRGLFLDYVSSKYSQSAKVSLEAGELIINEVDEIYIKKFDTETQIKEYVAVLK